MGCCDCREWCKRETGFYKCTTNTFGHGIVGKTVVNAIVKVILLIYWTAMWMYRLIDQYIIEPARRREDDPEYVKHREYSDYLTNWGDTLIFLYLLCSTIIVFQGSIIGIILDLVLYVERKYGTLPGGNSAKWFHYIAQLLFEIAFSYSVLITVLYFIFFPHEWNGSDVTNVHAHVMNVVVVLIEFVWNRIPFRFFHFIYVAIVGFLYILGNYLGYLSNPLHRNKTYESLIDWDDNDAGFFMGTIETLILFGVVGGSVIHIIAWCFNQLKQLLLNKCSQNSVHNMRNKNISISNSF